MADTKIEWADAVWNPVTGCQKVSAGCKNCYAETIAKRFWGERKFTDVQTHPDRLVQPLQWRKPRRVFVNSMSDLFHKDVDKDFIGDVFRVMEKNPQHTFMILTKRPQEMHYWFDLMNAERPLPNVWLGVSVENQQAADERIPYLLKTPAAVRFLSCEPLLGPVDLTKINIGNGDLGDCLNHKIDRIWDEPPGVKNWGKVDWVICGCESGRGSRPMHRDWARSLRDQCQAASVPFFLKQMVVDGKITKMPELDGKVWSEFPEVQS